eukprot:g6452.t1
MGGSGSWSDMNTVRKTDYKHHNKDGPSSSKGNRGKGHAKGYGKQERGKNNCYNASRNGKHSSWGNRLSRSVNRWLRDPFGWVLAPFQQKMQDWFYPEILKQLELDRTRWTGSTSPRLIQQHILHHEAKTTSSKKKQQLGASFGNDFSLHVNGTTIDKRSDASELPLCSAAKMAVELLGKMSSRYVASWKKNNSSFPSTTSTKEEAANAIVRSGLASGSLWVVAGGSTTTGFVNDVDSYVKAQTKLGRQIGPPLVMDSHAMAGIGLLADDELDGAVAAMENISSAKRAVFWKVLSAGFASLATRAKAFADRHALQKVDLLKLEEEVDRVLAEIQGDRDDQDHSTAIEEFEEMVGTKPTPSAKSSSSAASLLTKKSPSTKGEEDGENAGDNNSVDPKSDVLKKVRDRIQHAKFLLPMAASGKGNAESGPELFVALKPFVLAQADRDAIEARTNGESGGNNQTAKSTTVRSSTSESRDEEDINDMKLLLDDQEALEQSQIANEEKENLIQDMAEVIAERETTMSQNNMLEQDGAEEDEQRGHPPTKEIAHLLDESSLQDSFELFRLQFFSRAVWMYELTGVLHGVASAADDFYEEHKDLLRRQYGIGSKWEMVHYKSKGAPGGAAPSPGTSPSGVGARAGLVEENNKLNQETSSQSRDLSIDFLERRNVRINFVYFEDNVVDESEKAKSTRKNPPRHLFVRIPMLWCLRNLEFCNQGLHSWTKRAFFHLKHPIGREGHKLPEEEAFFSIAMSNNYLGDFAEDEKLQGADASYFTVADTTRMLTGYLPFGELTSAEHDASNFITSAADRDMRKELMQLTHSFLVWRSCG